MILNKQYLMTGKISIISVIILMTTQNMSRLALLILSFIMIGIQYKIQDFYFLGLTYIIVYVGAIAILFLFVVKITDAGKTPSLNTKNTSKWNIQSSLTFLLFKIIGSQFGHSLDFIMEYFVPSYNKEFTSISDIESFGYMLYLAYPLIIILLGILLWCVLIGILRISGL